MPDTLQNQAVWPQPVGQKPGCGFRVVKPIALFSLATGKAYLRAICDRPENSHIINLIILMNKFIL
jgi:hypothetical protein